MEKKTPKISVVTVCWNALEQLRKTVDNVSTLKYDNLEYVVIDGASTDGSVDYLNSKREIIDILVSEPDKGIYDAMNKGARLATGDFVIFMNAGDTFASTHVLDRLSPYFNGADVVYGSVVRNGVVKPAEEPHNGHRMYFCHQSALTRRDCLLEYPFDTNHRMSADFKQFKQLYLAGKNFVRTDIPVANFDLTGVSNVQRSKGIWDNITVIRETDSLIDRIKLLPRLYFVYFMLKIRKK